MIAAPHPQPTKLPDAVARELYASNSLLLFKELTPAVRHHAQRAALLAKEVARGLGLSEAEADLVYRAGLVHDIGKIAIPAAILSRPGPLTPQEWTLMRLHPQIGAALLKRAGGIWAACIAPLVVAHHERWDGGGYPFGLAGEAIPLGARILAVVDSFDAMTEHRPYQAPLSVADARAELRRCAGSAYDPAVVEAFLSHPGFPLE